MSLTKKQSKAADPVLVPANDLGHQPQQQQYRPSDEELRQMQQQQAQVARHFSDCDLFLGQ